MKVPTGWSKSQLLQLADVQTGLSKSEKRQGPFVKRPYLRVANVQNGYLDLSEIKEIGVPLNQVERFSLREDDVVITEGGDFDKLGRGCIWHGEIPNCVHQNHIFAIRTFDKGILRPRFLAYQLQSQYGRQYFLSCSKQTTNLASVNSSQIKGFPVLFPRFEEQDEIIDLLSTWDLATEKTEKLIKAKEKRFSWLINQLIFLSANSDKRWNHRRICDIADKVQRKSDGGDYPILTISSASGFVLQREKYDRFMAGKSVQDYILLRRGEFAYNKGNSLRYQFGCIFQLQKYEEALVPHVYVCFKVHEDIDPTFLSYVFQADYLKRQLGAIVNSGVRNNGLLNIRPGDFMKVTVPLPLEDQQKKIADVLNTARQEIELLKKQAAAYSKQKLELMRKLLTGQWRVDSHKDRP